MDSKKKPNGRYQYQCPGCGWYIKANGGSYCRHCLCDILFSEPSGTLREFENRIRRENYKPKPKSIDFYALTTS